MNILKVLFFRPNVAIGSRWQHSEKLNPFAVDAANWKVTVTETRDGFVQFSRDSGRTDSASLFDFLTTHSPLNP